MNNQTPVRVEPTESEQLKLTPTEEAFAVLYYAAEDPELRGNATQCYAVARFGERLPPDHDRYQSAATGGSRLLKREKVRARMREIRDEAEERAKQRAASFWEDVPDARETLRWAISGDWPEEFEGDDQAKRSAIEAAKTVIERAYGTPKLQHEHRVSGQAIVALTAHPNGDGEPLEDPEPDQIEEPKGRELPSPGPEIRGDGA